MLPSGLNLASRLLPPGLRPNPGGACMRKNLNRLILVFTAAVVSLSLAQGGKKRDEIKAAKGEITGSTAVFWREASDIATRNLFSGPGGKEHEPHGPFTFVDEDLDGSNPKFN